MKLTSANNLGAAMALSLCVVSSAIASNTITFNGQVLDSGCTITVDGGAADATVELGSTAASDLAEAGETGAPKQFSINLDSCPTASSANIVFSGPVDDDGDASHFKNTAKTTSAENVAVLLKQGGTNGSAIENNADNDVIDLSSSSATQNYTAQLVATGVATSGDVQSVLTYNVRYN